MFNPNIAVEENGQILYNGIKMELFVPKEFFDNGLAEEVGTSYYLFGNLRSFHYFDKDDDRRNAKEAILYYPLKFYTQPAESTKETCTFNGKTESYTVLTYYKGDVLFKSSEMVQDANNVQVFLDMLMGGKLDMIEYDKIPFMFQLCKYYNNVNFGVPAMYEEILVADFYRDPDDPSRPARYKAAVTDDPHFYARGITQREKVSYTSTFSGITFEDQITMLTMADNAKRRNRKEVVSDVEKVSLSLI